MSQLSLLRVKNHLRVDDDITHDDDLIQMYMDAAKLAAENFVDRILVDDVSEIPDDADGCLYLVVDKAIDAAMLLLIGSWYLNREAVIDIRLSDSELPLTFTFIMQRYRRMGV